MKKSKQKYYVVWKGHTPGIYKSWTECQLQINGYPKAQYKSFPSLVSAKEAFKGFYDDYKGKTLSKKILSPEEKVKYGTPILNSITVDGAGSGKTKKIEYQGVFTDTGTLLFHEGPFNEGTNNIAEFLALVHALAYCKKHQLDYPIYSDSKTAMSWVRNKNIKTQVKWTDKNKKLLELVKRALFWLDKNSYVNPILKWETKAWGENPADFGRK